MNIFNVISEVLKSENEVSTNKIILVGMLVIGCIAIYGRGVTK